MNWHSYSCPKPCGPFQEGTEGGGGHRAGLFHYKEHIVDSRCWVGGVLILFVTLRALGQGDGDSH
jgi:hypothetical protein